MTEPMTAREVAARILSDLYGDRTLSEMSSVEREARLGLVQTSVEADRAAERERLAQSGDVEGLAIELWEVFRPSAHYAFQFIATAEQEEWRVVARHVQAKLAATAEAARLEARDAIADLFDNGMYTKDGERWMKTPEGDVRLLDIAPNLERMFIQEQILKCGSPQPTVSERIRALRPDELEKKT